MCRISKEKIEGYAMSEMAPIMQPNERLWVVMGCDLRMFLGWKRLPAWCNQMLQYGFEQGKEFSLVLVKTSYRADALVRSTL